VHGRFAFLSAHLRKVGWLFAFGVLVFVVREMHIDTLPQKLAGVDWRLLAVAALLGVVPVLLQTVRWRYLLGTATVRFSTVLQAVYLGSLANLIVPLRTGEVVRGLVVSRRTGRGLASVFSTEFVERVADALAMAGMIWLVARVASMPGILGPVQAVLQVVLVGFVLLVAVAIVGERPLRRRLTTWNPPGRYGRALRRSSLGIASGLPLLRDWRAVTLSVSTAAGMILVQAVILWLSLRAFHVHLSLLQVAAVQAVISMGTLVPSTPGNLGSWQMACVVGLTMFGVEHATAAMFSLVVFVVLSLPTLVGGVVALATSPLSLSQLRGARHAHTHVDLLEPVPIPIAVPVVDPER
jgi:uncharacterized protein (TIRG00374 family)